MRTRALLAALCGALLLTAAACGDDTGDDVASAADATPTTEAAAATSTTMGHMAEPHVEHDALEGTSIAVTVTPDPKAGYNLHVETTAFTWAPERASTPHVPGEGHAHLYVDGTKVGRLYGPWAHLPLDPGTHEVKVTLNGNDHGDYVLGAHHLEDSVTVEVPAT